MPKRLPIFYSALLLTGVNLLLRFVGTSFQVYISNQLGAAGVGLLQLVMSVGGLAMVAGMAGIRTATMYLTAEELGKHRPGNVSWVLSGCFLYSIACSGSVAFLLYIFSPWIGENWIGDSRTVESLRLFAAFLPTSCLCGVMTGYFTAANRIGTLAAVEVAEQLVSMLITMTTLNLWGATDPARACQCVVFGSCAGALLTLLCLIFLRLREHPKSGLRISVSQRLRETAVPLAAADVLKSGINTLENLLVPKRLALHPRITDPLAAFGSVSGMVFPVMMFPACILFALAELLIPELARCAAADSRVRIQYLVKRALRVTMLYGVFFCGILFLISEDLCLRLYGNAEAGFQLRLYSLMIPMLYCDAITDAMTKGLGQQKICVRYNILTSTLDVLFLYILLPKYEMTGYFVSFFLTHMLNFLLSLHLLAKITKANVPIAVPFFTIGATVTGIWGASGFASVPLRCTVYCALLISLLYLLKIISREDLLWLRNLALHNKK